LDNSIPGCQQAVHGGASAIAGSTGDSRRIAGEIPPDSRIVELQEVLDTEGHARAFTRAAELRRTLAGKP
jgi:hypothetical protein